MLLCYDTTIFYLLRVQLGKLEQVPHDKNCGTPRFVSLILDTMSSKYLLPVSNKTKTAEGFKVLYRKPRRVTHIKACRTTVATGNTSWSHVGVAPVRLG